ncbi:hypothetical protein FIBSPDRAFT_1049800 [Athelia psychrophila]|uniref:Galactose oxidase n=1 Tax=Athelia psychrophila TaxID=1759441 RepID=A0A166BQI2_9AGAM|nr:hypothetical protein FIBSPDRAFT_1049800 [Fibularhizoctonia sp. CBS 109695]
MVKALTLLSVIILSFSEVALATSNPCLALNWDFDLFVFGLNGKDYNASSQSTWMSATPAKDITSSGRPPFDGPHPKCFLAQYQDTVYVLGADTANPASVYMYNFLAKSWSQQAVKTNGFNPASWNGILDHDTNVIFAISAGNLYTLSLGEQVKAQSTPLTWQPAGAVPYPSSYNPVMSIANNHISFFDVPGVPAGSADLYVIHFSYWQQSQKYPLVSGSGSSFPASQGKATSFSQKSIDNVQQEIAFIPEGAANTYVVDVLTNTTQKLAGPTNKDSTSQYFAGPTALVQLASNGVVYFLPYEEGKNSANAAAKWSKVKSLLSFAPTKSTTRDIILDMDLVKRSGAPGTCQVGSLYTICRVLSTGLVLSGIFCLL